MLPFVNFTLCCLTNGVASDAVVVSPELMMVAMHEFDDLDILLRSTLSDDVDLAPPPSARSWYAIRSRIKRRHTTRLMARLIGTCHVALDAMLLRGTNEPIYRVPLEGRLLSLLSFIM